MQNYTQLRPTNSTQTHKQHVNSSVIELTSCHKEEDQALS